MIQTSVYSTYQNNYYDNSVQRKENKVTSKTENKSVSKTGISGKTSQVELSSKAKSVLEQLEEKYSDMDFFVADFANGDDAKEIMSRGTKEFSVLFSSEELEKMASDEKYLQEKMSGIEGAVRMSEQINEQFGFQSTFGKDDVSSSILCKIGISFNDDGSVSYFAELEKSSAKQKERIQQAREKGAEEKKEAAKKEKAKEREEVVSGKRVTVVASSEEELIQKITQIDWSEIKEEKQEVSGSRFDCSI